MTPRWTSTGRAAGLFLAACLLTPGHAETSAGDANRGKQLAVQCAACHGIDGNSPSSVNPKLGGQHEAYLFLALQAYVNGARSDSLMRGAVLNKSEQELRDIAAYYAAQGGTNPQSAAKAGPDQAPAVMRFDHGDRTAAFLSLAARAKWLAKRSSNVDEQACDSGATAVDRDSDSDADGVADAYDAAPNDRAEFLSDSNADGYFEICNIAQLGALSVAVNSADQARLLTRSYQLTRDLDGASLRDFSPLGNCGPTGNCMRALGEFGFAGVFDGQGHSIRGLTIRKPAGGGVGFFGVLAESGVVMNLHLDDVTVTGRAGTGALVGSNFGVIFNSAASGQVDGALAIGGLVGGSGGLVLASRFTGSVQGQQAVGGLVGDMTGAVYYSETAARVSGSRGVGGLVGLNTFGSVLGSSFNGDVTGSNDVGGLVGVNTDAKIRNSFSIGAVLADGDNVGGLVGFNSLSSVQNSYSRVQVTGKDGVGGLIGRNNGTANNSYATGPIQSDGLGGGVVGIVVEGTQQGTFAGVDVMVPYGSEQVDLSALTGASTGWAPAAPPVVNLLDYFCDQDQNGFIDPTEHDGSNYIWRFSAGKTFPVIGCVAGAAQ
jgi:cytochrome c553